HGQEQIAPKASAQNADTEPKGTTRAPMFVQVVPAPKTAEERAQETDEREEKKVADRWLVRWTAALLFATVGLILGTGILGYFAFRQAQDTRSSIAIAERSASAAADQVMLSRHVMEHVERALIFPSETHTMAGIKG